MNNAKKFILDNSPIFAEAVENGLDIRMDEDEIFEWMERYRASTPKTVQLCPKCLGEAVIPNNGFSTSAIHRQCPVCNGQRIFIV